MRKEDWDITGPQGSEIVHAHATKGLSLTTNHPPGPLEKKKKVYTIDDSYFNNHAEFGLVHDGGHGGHPEGHVSMVYRGPDIAAETLKATIKNNIPWHRRSFDEDASRVYRRYIGTESGYRRALLEKAYSRALEELEELD